MNDTAIPKRHFLGPLSFLGPEGWLDTSILSFRDPQASRPAPTVTIWREPLRDGETVRDHVSRKLVSFARDVPNLELLESKDLPPTGGRLTLSIRFRFSPPHEADHSGMIEQVMVFVAGVIHSDPYVTLFVTARPIDARTPSTAANTTSTLENALAEVMNSVRFDEGSPSLPPVVDLQPPMPFSAGRRSTPR